MRQVSGIGKISQLLFAVLQPGNVVANIIAGGVAEVGTVHESSSTKLTIRSRLARSSMLQPSPNRDNHTDLTQGGRPHAGPQDRASPPSFPSIPILRPDDRESRQRFRLHSRLQVLHIGLHHTRTPIRRSFSGYMVRSLWMKDDELVSRDVGSTSLDC